MHVLIRRDIRGFRQIVRGIVYRDAAIDMRGLSVARDKIIQVITNLVDNAVKYSPSYSRIILMTSPTL